MKEVEQLQKDKLEITAEQKKEFKLKFVNSIRPYNGHTCYEFNLETSEIKEAEFKTVDIHFDDAILGRFPTNKKVIINPNCIYDTALNITNFKKKIAKIIDIKL